MKLRRFVLVQFLLIVFYFFCYMLDVNTTYLLVQPVVSGFLATRGRSLTETHLLGPLWGPVVGGILFIGLTAANIQLLYRTEQLVGKEAVASKISRIMVTGLITGGIVLMAGVHMSCALGNLRLIVEVLKLIL